MEIRMINYRRITIILVFLIAISLFDASAASEMTGSDDSGTGDTVAAFIKDLIRSGKPAQATKNATDEKLKKPSVLSLKSPHKESVSPEDLVSYRNLSCILTESNADQVNSSLFLENYSGKYNFTDLSRKNKELYDEIISRYQGAIPNGKRFAECCAYPQSSF
ncbi:MAG: hypothetical protein JXA44_06195 [Methanospirillaceae archaeon]|nr:hypothetical protein [Methanospirillaceae archaeon]